MQAMTDEELEREADMLEQEARMVEWEQHEQSTRQTFKRDISHVDAPAMQGTAGETPAQIKVGVGPSGQGDTCLMCSGDQGRLWATYPQ